jgi:hypothetical protein
MLLCTASVEVHQNERQSLMNGTGFRQTIPLRNFGLRTLYAPYKATHRPGFWQKPQPLNFAITTRFHAI